MKLRDAFLAVAKSRETERDVATRQVVEAYLASFESGDVQGRLALFAVDARFEDPVGTPPIEGHDGLLVFWGQGTGMNISMKLERLSVNGPEAAFVFTATLSSAGAGEVVMRVIETMMLNEQGRISRMRAYFDVGSIG